MKKRLLITSIVMMLVVAVALGTSTYAWFTSNATVKANEISLKATTTTAPALGISWTDGNYGTEITPIITDYAEDETFTFAPVAPLTLSKTGTITDSTVAFNTATTYSSAGDFKFGANGAAPSKQATYTLTDGSGAGKGHTSFFLKNLSSSNPLTGTLTMTASITGDAAHLLRVGVFKYNGTSEKYELIEVLAAQDATGYTGISAGEMTSGTYYRLVNGQYITARQATSTEEDPDDAAADMAAQVAAGTADWYIGMTATASQFYTATGSAANAKAVYGSIVKDASVNAMATYDCATSLALGTNLAAGTVIELKVIVWMDAAALGDAQQGFEGHISLNFTVA